MVKAHIKKCPECQGINLVYDEHKGEVICQDCGLVVEEKMVDTSQEITGSFDKSNKKGDRLLFLYKLSSRKDSPPPSRKGSLSPFSYVLNFLLSQQRDNFRF